MYLQRGATEPGELVKMTLRGISNRSCGAPGGSAPHLAARQALARLKPGQRWTSEKEETGGSRLLQWTNGFFSLAD